MEIGPELVSPKQVARAIGVSESSLKRWCDKGIMKTVRTGGGHRKLSIAEVLRYARESEHPLVAPEILGLPPVSDHARLGLSRCRSLLIDALLEGDEAQARQIVVNLHLAKHGCSVICDQVIAAAFHQIGERWACREADIYQERRGGQIALRMLYELRALQPPHDRRLTAIGGTLEGDHYVLPSTMAELVLRVAGFQAVSLGTSIPTDSLLNAIRKTRPSVFWLSVSHVSAEDRFLVEFERLSQACADCGAALVLGGRALHAGLRQRMTYASFGDTMQHLESFAKTLRRTLGGRGGPSRKQTSSRSAARLRNRIR